jgi:pimeloyl-ACP methyl ester carboxylesterase
MDDSLPTILIPGLFASPRFFEKQLPALWRYGPVTIADHTRDETMAGIARRLLANAPPKFALVGHSMGGYAAFEVMRQAPDRVVKLALMNTTARPDVPEQTEKRKNQIALAESGRFGEVPELQFPALVHPTRKSDGALLRLVKSMAEDTGPDGFVRQQKAIMARVDSRPGLASIACPVFVLVGDRDEVTPVDRAQEIADGVAHGQIVIVKDCGHLSALERPEQVTDALTAWIAR